MAKQITPIFKGYIEKGILQVNEDRQIEFHSYLHSLEGEEVEINVKKRRKIRGRNQNALYWVYLQLLSEDTGYTPQELHDLFKEAFIPAEKITAFGLESTKYKTTTDMSPMEFSDYIKNIEEKTGINCPSEEDAANFSVT